MKTPYHKCDYCYQRFELVDCANPMTYKTWKNHGERSHPDYDLWKIKAQTRSQGLTKNSRRYELLEHFSHDRFQLHLWIQFCSSCFPTGAICELVQLHIVLLLPVKKRNKKLNSCKQEWRLKSWIEIKSWICGNKTYVIRNNITLIWRGQHLLYGKYMENLLTIPSFALILPIGFIVLIAIDDFI